MITAVLTNTNNHRTVDAPDSDEINFGDIKALATGDPRVLDLLRAKRTLGELEIAQRSWQRRITRSRNNIATFTADIGDAETRIAALSAAIEQLSQGPVEITSINPRWDESHNAAIPHMGLGWCTAGRSDF